MNKLLYLLMLVGCWQIQSSCAQSKNNATKSLEILTGADQTEVYLPLLKGKSVIIVVTGA
jgi:hypothetical protein